MFIGEYSHTIDAKGRVSLPADFRKNLAGVVYLTKGYNNCIQLFSAEEFEAYLANFTKREAFDERMLKLRRSTFAGSAAVELDSTGRIRIPQNLRDHARISKDVVVNGDGSRIEIWDSKVWEEYISDISMETLAGELSAEGLLG